MERVAPRLDLQVDHAAHGAPELGGVGAGLQLELVEGVHAREDHDRLQPGLVVVDAVEQVVVVAGTLAVRGEGGRGAPGQAAARRRCWRPGLPRRTPGTVRVRLHEVAAVQGQGLDLLLLRWWRSGRRTRSARAASRPGSRPTSVICPSSSFRSMRTFWSTPRWMLARVTFLKPAHLRGHRVGARGQRRRGVLAVRVGRSRSG